MKHFFLACLFPALLTAQSMQLTEQLGKTVLYGDIAVSPDGTHIAWVQSTAATTTKQIYIRGTSGNAAAPWLASKALASGPTPIPPGRLIPRRWHFSPAVAKKNSGNFGL
jgi:hypothetical protein